MNKLFLALALLGCACCKYEPKIGDCYFNSNRNPEVWESHYPEINMIAAIGHHDYLMCYVNRQFYVSHEALGIDKDWIESSWTKVSCPPDLSVKLCASAINKKYKNKENSWN